jgi:hypothetical protein
VNDAPSSKEERQRQKAINEFQSGYPLPSISGRDGASRSSNDNFGIKLLSLGTSRADINPQQLFAVGWSAYFSAR